MPISVGKKYQNLVSRSKCACQSHVIDLLNRRITCDLSRRGFIAGISTSLVGLGFPDRTSAQSPAKSEIPEQTIVLYNLRLFDGLCNKLRENVSVIIKDNIIKDVVALADPRKLDNARVIDCGGRTLIPGLIDAHWHAMLATLTLPELMSSDVGFIHLAASAESERTLMRGFTTVRDLAGPTFALKKAIDTGLILGPRIYPSGAIISQTAGHGDFRFTYETPRSGSSLSRFEVIGASSISDSPDAVRRSAREQLMAGASQIKIAAGGGIISLYDPIDVNQSRLEEIRAAVEAAEDWGTYVAAHVYLPVGIRRCLEAGVKSIEHGQLTDAETVRIIADKGAWWSLQAFLNDDDATNFPVGSFNYEKQKLVTAGTDNSYNLAKKHKIKTAWGTDILFDSKKTVTQGRQLTKLKRWYTPIEILKQATSINAELLKLSGHRNPYPEKLGVIEKGAYADMILVEGDPTTDIMLLSDPEQNFKIIIKDGKIHKMTI